MMGRFGMLLGSMSRVLPERTSRVLHQLLTTWGLPPSASQGLRPAVGGSWVRDIQPWPRS